jgi:hypothetical protein
MFAKWKELYKISIAENKALGAASKWSVTRLITRTFSKWKSARIIKKVNFAYYFIYSILFVDSIIFLKGLIEKCRSTSYQFTRDKDFKIQIPGFYKVERVNKLDNQNISWRWFSWSAL